VDSKLFKDSNRFYSSVLFSRTCFFDCTTRNSVKSEKVYLKRIKINYSETEIEIARPVLGVAHEKLFYSLFAVGKRNYENLDNKLLTITVDLYQLRKVAGLSVRYDTQKIIEHLEAFKFVYVTFYKEGRKGWKLEKFIEEVDSCEVESRIPGKKKVILTISLSYELLKFIELNTCFSLPKDVLAEINRIKESYTYRTVMFFMTQTKPFSISFEKLIRLIDSDWEETLSDKRKKYKIKQRLKESKKVLEKYNIFFDGSTFTFNGRTSQVVHVRRGKTG